jgi:hypothetical protein
VSAITDMTQTVSSKIMFIDLSQHYTMSSAGLGNSITLCPAVFARTIILHSTVLDACAASKLNVVVMA